MFGKTNVLILTTLIIFISASMQVFGFPWNYDMWKQKSIKPYEMPMSYPKGTVTTDGKTNPIEREKMEAITSNQLDSSKLDIKKGKELYMIHCAVCHGEKADGNGYSQHQAQEHPDDGADGGDGPVLAVQESPGAFLNGGGDFLHAFCPLGGGAHDAHRVGAVDQGQDATRADQQVQLRHAFVPSSWFACR